MPPVQVRIENRSDKLELFVPPHLQLDLLSTLRRRLDDDARPPHALMTKVRLRGVVNQDLQVMAKGEMARDNKAW